MSNQNRTAGSVILIGMGSVGLLRIIDMLNPDNGIDSVTFQSFAVSGWDDVVARYESGKVDYYQINTHELKVQSRLAI
ncbi:MAG: hypothetical protein IPN18_15780 [Ignavibacteriales bacterium]|nr:hypothetical protein [Ignavibacteriales bacterium]